MNEKNQNLRFHYRLLAAGSCGFMADALEIALLTFISPCTGFNISELQRATLITCVFVGQMIGSLVFGKLADMHGRRSAYQISICLICFGGLLSALAPDYYSLLVLRTAVGAGVGGSVVPFDLMVEVFPRSQRGACMTLVGGCWGFGTIYVAAMAAWVLTQDTWLGFIANWRLLIVLATLPCFAALAMLRWVPESPLWHVDVGDAPSAVVTVRRIARENGVVLPETDECYVALFEAERARGACAETKTGAWSDLVTDPAVRALAPVLALNWFCEGASFYGMVVFQNDLVFGTTSGCTFDYFGIFAAALGALLAVPPAMWMVEQAMLGRIGSGVLGYSVGGVLTIALFAVATNSAQIALALLAQFAIGIAVSMTWVITPELYPTHMRCTALSVGYCIARVGAISATYFVYSGLANFEIGLGVGLAMLCGAASLLLVPVETRGKALGPQATAPSGADADSPPRESYKPPLISHTPGDFAAVV